MSSEFGFIATCVLAITAASLLVLPSGQATAWVGNDNGEFDSKFGAGYVGLEESFSRAMLWPDSPPNNLVTMQYNPDEIQSYNLQVGADWFQTVIVNQSDGCTSVSLQVWDTFDGTQDYLVNPPLGCLAGSLASGALWYIREDTPGGYPIADVYFSESGADASKSYTLYPPSSWSWIRSNLCWCGAGGSNGSPSFISAYGTSIAYSDQRLLAIDPPILVGTQENSNMPYNTFQGSGTTTMSQTFGWPGSSPGFKIYPPSSTYQMRPCQTTSATITVQSHDGFYGYVNFRDTAPNGFLTSFNPPYVQLTSGSSASTTYSVSVPCNAPSYEVWGVEGYTGAATYWIDACYPTNCGTGGSVAQGTLISLSNGTQVPVQNLHVGSQLLSYNLTAGRYSISTISKFFSVTVNNEMVIHFGQGKPLVVDQNRAQRLYVKLPNATIRLVPVTELQTGYDVFNAIQQTWVPITGIELQNGGNHEMYDIFTTDPGNYIANGILDPLKT